MGFNRATESVKLSLVGFSLLALAACETLPQLIGPKVTEPEAAAFYQLGNYKEAASAYTKLARSSREARPRYQVLSAQAWREEGDYTQMKSALKGVQRRKLDRENALLLDLLEAELALNAGDARTALSLLVVDVKSVPFPLQPRFYELRARALALNTDFADAARERALLNELLEPLERAANEHELKSLLAKLSPESQLQLQRALGRGDPLLKWMNGARTSDDGSFADALSDTYATGDVVDLSQIEPTAIRKIALVLPSSGALAPAAKAVMDGVMSAYFSDSRADRPEIVLVDSGTTPESAAAAIEAAVQAGADRILGPFQRDQVTYLFAQAQVNVPTLALNFADANVLPPKGSLQMALLPEEEAAAAALRMHARGLQRITILASDDDFGKRAAGAFEAKLVALGGSVGERAFFPPAATDQASAIRTALGVSESQARISMVRSIVGIPVSAQASRRYDLDGLFLAARPAQARMLVPQLKLYDADDWPMLATSHIYAGSPSPSIDRDIDGVEFCDAPWIFDAANSAGIPQRSSVSGLASSSGAGGRLFAYGIDAYRLLGYIEWLEANPEQAISGAIGRLSADSRGSIRRAPNWAKMVNGSPQVQNQ